jgi:hypothetical protein
MNFLITILLLIFTNLVFADDVKYEVDAGSKEVKEIKTTEQPIDLEVLKREIESYREQAKYYSDKAQEKSNSATELQYKYDAILSEGTSKGVNWSENP